MFTAFCESHTSQISFHVVARLLRAATGIKGLHPHAARAQVYAQVRDADPEDLALFDDLMGIADPDVKLPKIDPDARRRRLTKLVTGRARAGDVAGNARVAEPSKSRLPADQIADGGHGLRLAPRLDGRSGPCPRQPHGAFEAIDRLDPLERP